MHFPDLKRDLLHEALSAFLSPRHPGLKKKPTTRNWLGLAQPPLAEDILPGAAREDARKSRFRRCNGALLKNEADAAVREDASSRDAATPEPPRARCPKWRFNETKKAGDARAFRLPWRRAQRCYGLALDTMSNIDAARSCSALASASDKKSRRWAPSRLVFSTSSPFRSSRRAPPHSRSSAMAGTFSFTTISTLPSLAVAGAGVDAPLVAEVGDPRM